MNLSLQENRYREGSINLWLIHRNRDYKDLAIKEIARKLLETYVLVQVNKTKTIYLYTENYTKAKKLDTIKFRDLIYTVLEAGILNHDDISLIREYIPEIKCIVEPNREDHKNRVKSLKDTYKHLRKRLNVEDVYLSIELEDRGYVLDGRT